MSPDPPKSIASLDISVDLWYNKCKEMVLSIIVDTISQKIYKPASIYYSTYSLR